VFGDTGSITVVSGKSYQINYDAKYVQVIGVQPNKDLEIIGTHLAGSQIGSTGTTQTPSTQPPVPTTPQQTKTQNNTLQQNQTSTPVQKPTINLPPQNPPSQEILSKIFHFKLPNLPFNITGNQIIEFSVIASVILILIIVIASSKSKTRKEIRK
jgi:hypothetical protein